MKTQNCAKITSSFLILIVVLCAISCNTVKKKVNVKSNLSAKGDTISPQILYSPLTFDKFNDVMNGIDSLTSIHFGHSNYQDDILHLDIVAGLHFPSLFEDYLDYHGVIRQTIRSPREFRYYEREFTPNEVEAVYDYLIDNSAYFFNNEEFDGIYPPPIPSIGGTYVFCSGKYDFSLEISDPDEPFEVWAIAKCVDEYPAPDHPLYALFEMLEDDFIDQFTEADRKY